MKISNNRFLVDTSVWIDFFKGNYTIQTSLLEDSIVTDQIFICPVIIQEVLQGVKHDHDFYRIQNSFLGFPLLELDYFDLSIGAAKLYRTLRKKGITIRSGNDCIIAYYCLSYDIPLLHSDKDFEFIARELPIKLIKPDL